VTFWERGWLLGLRVGGAVGVLWLGGGGIV